MDCYLTALLYAVIVGVFDYTIKGVVAYNKLHTFYRGWSWHITIFIGYVLLLVAKAGTMGNWNILWMLPAYSAEDATYYIIDSVRKKRVCYNSWLGIWRTPAQYWITILVINLVTLTGGFVL